MVNYSFGKLTVGIVPVSAYTCTNDYSYYSNNSAVVIRINV